MRTLQLSVATLLLYLVALGSGQMSSVTSTAMMNVTATAMVNATSMPGAEGSPMVVPDWAIALIVALGVVGGVFLVLATVVTVGMCVGIVTKKDRKTKYRTQKYRFE